MSPEVDPVDDDPLYPARNSRLVRYWRRVGLLRAGYRVLDVGAGSGHVTAALKGVGDLVVDCVEPGEGHQRKLLDQGCRVYPTVADVPAENVYDAMILIDVIEHVDDPVALLGQMKRRLARDGQIFLTTPAGDLRKPLLTPAVLGAYDTPLHVHFFTPRSLAYALRKAGFKYWRYRYVLAFYPADDKDEHVYESAWARRHALKREVLFRWRGGRHLTYFAR